MPCSACRNDLRSWLDRPILPHIRNGFRVWIWRPGGFESPKNHFRKSSVSVPLNPVHLFQKKTLSWKSYRRYQWGLMLQVSRCKTILLFSHTAYTSYRCTEFDALTQKHSPKTHVPPFFFPDELITLTDKLFAHLIFGSLDIGGNTYYSVKKKPAPF